MSDWDGPDYITVATSGYSDPSETNFFPLYPLLIRLVNEIVSSPLISALVVSWSCLVGAIYFGMKVLKKLFRLTDNREALRGILFFILFPSAVFLIATYSESLLAFLSLAALYFALQKKYLLAGLATMFVTATHITGIFIVVAVAIMLWEEKVRLRNIVIASVIGCLGLASYMVYLQAKFQSPIEFITAQQAHGWLEHTAHNPNLGLGWLNVILIILILTSIFYWWKRRRSLSVYSFLFLLIPIVGGQFGGFNRYVLIAFPVQFMLYGRFRSSKFAYPVCLALSAMLWSFFLFQYAGGYVGG
jgi:hypothetical protein